MRRSLGLCIGFLIGQAALIPFNIDNWTLCFGLCLGSITYELLDKTGQYMKDKV